MHTTADVAVLRSPEITFINLHSTKKGARNVLQRELIDVDEERKKNERKKGRGIGVFVCFKLDLLVHWLQQKQPELSLSNLTTFSYHIRVVRHMVRINSPNCLAAAAARDHSLVTVTHLPHTSTK
jgi:hypothetical protein